MKTFFFVLNFILQVSLFAEAANNNAGINITGAGDIVGTFGDAANRLSVREAELVVYAPIDHLFDGWINLAAHQEEGEVFFELHELYIGSSKLIPRSRFRLGQFFLGVGRLNRFHRHDWPFISAPKVHSTFFDEEAVADTGIEYSWLLPTSFYLDLTVGLTNGWVFGHSHTMGETPHFPTHYFRLANYFDLSDQAGMENALNYLGRRDSDGTGQWLFGFDSTAKWREAKILRWLIQSEVWLRKLTPAGADSEESIGFYLFPQYGFDPSWFLGVRFDGFTNLSLEDAGGTKLSNFDYAIVPTVSYKASEFSTLRLAYTYGDGSGEGSTTPSEHKVELQAVFVLGAHPAHDF